MTKIRSGLSVVGALTAFAFVGAVSAQESESASARATEASTESARVDAAKAEGAKAASEGRAAAGVSYIAGYVYPPGSYPLGKTYNQLGADWWKWGLKTPASRSPLTDTTGAFCGQGQSSSYATVFYLAGFLDGGTVSRTCTVPVGRHLLIPVVNGIAAAFPTDPAAEKTEAYLRAQIAYLGDAANLRLEIDGTSVPNVARWYEESVKFSTTLPANNVFGADANQVLDPAYDAGYYLAVTPLPSGVHTVHFHGETDAGNVDVTYRLTVR